MQTFLSVAGCVERQRRFAELLVERSCDAAVISDWRDVYYFTGVFTEMLYPRALLIEVSGKTVLAAEAEFADAPVQQQLQYAPDTVATLNFDHHAALAAALEPAIGRTARVAVQAEELCIAMAEMIDRCSGASLLGIDDALLRMQAVKDADEIMVLRRCNQLNDIGYAAVRDAIREGASETEVLSAGNSAVVEAAGYNCDYNGDFRCGVPGGFATDRRCRAGELYIVDAWVTYRGYRSDLCRTFPVTTIDSQQRRAWEMTEQTVLMAEQMIRPGVRCRQVYDAIHAAQEKIKPKALIHHGGHGTGLRAHTYPRINPKFDDVFEENNVFTIEPGVYGEELGGGIRLEYNYVLTNDGPERLSEFPISCPQGR